MIVLEVDIVIVYYNYSSYSNHIYFVYTHLDIYAHSIIQGVLYYLYKHLVMFVLLILQY